MLVDVAARRGLDLRASFMVGDRWRDVEAGHRAGCTTVLLGTETAEPTSVEPDYQARTLLEAVGFILRHEQERRA
jgi:D-glycero-D-manno-heptose 1,7-bisphosphate phosphatase